MSDEQLAKLHEFLGNPVRLRILFEIYMHDKLSFDNLVKVLKTENPENVREQLKALGELVSKTEDEYVLTSQSDWKQQVGLYFVTEKGKEALEQWSTYPEIAADNYKEIIDQKFHSEAALNSRKLWYTSLGALMGFCIGYFICMLFFGPDNSISLLAIFVFSPVLGGLAGYLIGDAKYFKRPEPEWTDEQTFGENWVKNHRIYRLTDLLIPHLQPARSSGKRLSFCEVLLQSKRRKRLPYCRRCGVQLQENARFCHKCGTQVADYSLPLRVTTPAPSSKSSISAPLIVLIAVVSIVVIAVAVIFVVVTFNPVSSSQINHQNQTNISNLSFWLQKRIT